VNSGVLKYCQLIVALMVAMCANTVLAHQQGSSYSQWQLPSGLPSGLPNAPFEPPQVSVRISHLDLTRVGLHANHTPNFTAQAAAYLQQRLTLASNQQPCVPQTANMPLTQPGWSAFRWVFVCPNVDNDSWQIQTTVLLDKAPGHLHFARLQRADSVFDQLLTTRQNQWLIQPKLAVQPSGFVHYLSLGVRHILSGWDHLAFVLGLMLLAFNWRQLAWLISGFTVGHSVTLVSATLGWLAPNIHLIEAVIAWSIAVLAAEVLWRTQSKRLYWALLPLLLVLLGVAVLPPGLLVGLGLLSMAYFVALSVRPGNAAQVRTVMTLAFGLIHGCGFAAILGELDLATEQLLPALFGFNLGVEFGQLLVVMVIWPLLLFVTRKLSLVPVIIALGLLGLASFWWVLRVL